MTAPVKRFVVFACGNYYPIGGWGDHVGSYDTVEEARVAADYHRGERGADWTDIIDLLTGENLDD
jgi:hypothetical protein